MPRKANRRSNPAKGAEDVLTELDQLVENVENVPPLADKKKRGRTKKQVKSISSSILSVVSSVTLPVETSKSKERRGRPKKTASQLLNDYSFNLNVLFDVSSVSAISVVLSDDSKSTEADTSCSVVSSCLSKKGRKRKEKRKVKRGGGRKSKGGVAPIVDNLSDIVASNLTIDDAFIASEVANSVDDVVEIAPSVSSEKEEVEPSHVDVADNLSLFSETFFDDVSSEIAEASCSSIDNVTSTPVKRESTPIGEFSDSKKTKKRVYKRKPGRPSLIEQASILTEAEKESGNLIENQNVTHGDAVFLKSYYNKSERHRSLPIFGGMCSNCGVMLFPKNTFFQRLQQCNVLIQNNTDYINNAALMFKHMTPTLPTVTANMLCWIKCQHCYENDKTLWKYLVVNPETGSCAIPDELKNLEPPQRALLSLIRLWSITEQKTRLHQRQWKFIRGEIRLQQRSEKELHGMYMYMISREVLQKSVALLVREEKYQAVKTAFLWLKHNNALFQHLYSILETIYGHSDVYQTFPAAVEGSHCDFEQKPLEGHLGKEEAVIMQPLIDIQPVADMVGDEDVIGEINFRNEDVIMDEFEFQRHEMNKLKQATLFSRNLEEKLFPVLFPYGAGGYFPYDENALPLMMYTKFRMNWYDNRFSASAFYPFFRYDWMTKYRLFHFNKARSCQSLNQVEPLTAAKVSRAMDHDRNPYRMYGNIVPHTIPGSRSYWSHCFNDILAMQRKFGVPHFFITLTQNDSWGEIQAHIRNGAGGTCEMRSMDREKAIVSNESPVLHSTAVVHAYQKRFRRFMKEFVTNKKGPFGQVISWFYRIEFQNRGALHTHMVIWCRKGTVPENVVMAEVPRGDLNDPIIALARKYVLRFQVHQFCTDDRCFKGPQGKKLKKCKYGFPFGIMEKDTMTSDGVRWLYRRRDNEDSKIVPYNLNLLMFWDGHINVQKVTNSAWAMYLAKYLTKADHTISVHVPANASEPQKYLLTRTVGRLEVEMILQCYNLSRGSHEVVYLPTELNPNFRVLKRKAHLPQNPDSTDVYYDSLLDKYFQRPHALNHLTYPQYMEKYRIESMYKHDEVKQFEDETSDSEVDEEEYNQTVRDDEDLQRIVVDGELHEFAFNAEGVAIAIEVSEPEIIPLPDVENAISIEKEVPVVKIKGGKKVVEMRDLKNRLLLPRRKGKEAIARWHMVKPYGDQIEKFYQIKLLMNVPWRTKDEFVNERNRFASFLAMAAEYNLISDAEDVFRMVKEQRVMGIPFEQIKEACITLVSKGLMHPNDCDEFLCQAVQPNVTMDELNEHPAATFIDTLMHDDPACDIGDMRFEKVPFVDFKEVVASFTESQRKLFSFVESCLHENKQILLAVVGAAGTGKSYILKSIEALCQQNYQQRVVKLGTTGIAAYLIGGCTIHNFFRLNIDLKSSLEFGTPEQANVSNADVLIIDEFSMLDQAVFNRVDMLSKQYASEELQKRPFGGKSVILFGDPCQLPPVNTPMYNSLLFSRFKIAILKEVKRQEGDQEFAAILNEVRIGQLSAESIAILKGHVKTYCGIWDGTFHDPEHYLHKFRCDELPRRINACEIEEEAVVLTSKRIEREDLNGKYLSMFCRGKEPVTLTAFDTDEMNVELDQSGKNLIKKYFRERLPDVLQIKIGCQVMLCRNLSVRDGWINGTRATVHSIEGKVVVLKHIDSGMLLPLLPWAQKMNLKVRQQNVIRHQYPIRLSFAVTIHKAQGMTLNKVAVSLCKKSIFASGQGYVAMSRVRSLENLQLIHFDPEAVFLAPFYRDLLNAMEKRDILNVQLEPFLPPYPLFERYEQDKRYHSEQEHDENAEVVPLIKESVENDENADEEMQHILDVLAPFAVVGDEEIPEDEILYVNIGSPETADVADISVHTDYSHISKSSSCSSHKSNLSDLSGRHNIRWTVEMKEVLLKCYGMCTPTERGYLQRLKCLFLLQYPDMEAVSLNSLYCILQSVEKRIPADNTRIQWSCDLRKEVVCMYKDAIKENRKGYMKRLFAAFVSAHPDFVGRVTESSIRKIAIDNLCCFDEENLDVETASTIATNVSTDKIEHIEKEDNFLQSPKKVKKRNRTLIDKSNEKSSPTTMSPCIQKLKLDTDEAASNVGIEKRVKNVGAAKIQHRRTELPILRGVICRALDNVRNSHDNLVPVVRIVDFWSGDPIVSELAHCLQFYGVQVEFTKERSQLSVNCGYIAAKVACHLYEKFETEQDWLHSNVTFANSTEIIRVGNMILSNNTETNNLKARFLEIEEVTKLCLEWCHEADMNQSWLLMLPTSFNFFMVGLREMLKNIKNRRSNYFKAAIINTASADMEDVHVHDKIGGVHWFTVGIGFKEI